MFHPHMFKYTSALQIFCCAEFDTKNQQYRHNAAVHLPKKQEKIYKVKQTFKIKKTKTFSIAELKSHNVYL